MLAPDFISFVERKVSFDDIWDKESVYLPAECWESDRCNFEGF